MQKYEHFIASYKYNCELYDLTTSFLSIYPIRKKHFESYIEYLHNNIIMYKQILLCLDIAL